MSSPGCLYLQNAVQAVQRISNTRASNIVTSLFWTSVAAAPPFLSHTLSWPDTHKLHGNMPTLPPTPPKKIQTCTFQQIWTSPPASCKPYITTLQWRWRERIPILVIYPGHGFEQHGRLFKHRGTWICSCKNFVLATICTSHTSSHVHKTNALIVTCSVSAPVRQNYCQHQAVVNKHEKQQMKYWTLNLDTKKEYREYFTNNQEDKSMQNLTPTSWLGQWSSLFHLDVDWLQGNVESRHVHKLIICTVSDLLSSGRYVAIANQRTFHKTFLHISSLFSTLCYTHPSSTPELLQINWKKDKVLLK